MPVEIIGEAGTAGAEREWINAECQLAIRHLKKVCGEPPPEMELEVQWQEHDLDEYPTIVLTWEDAMRGAPWEYIEKCEEALTEHKTGEEVYKAVLLGREERRCRSATRSIKQTMPGVSNTTASRNQAPHHLRPHQAEVRRDQGGQFRRTSCGLPWRIVRLRLHLRM